MLDCGVKWLPGGGCHDAPPTAEDAAIPDPRLLLPLTTCNALVASNSAPDKTNSVDPIALFTAVDKTAYMFGHFVGAITLGLFPGCKLACIRRRIDNVMPRTQLRACGARVSVFTGLRLAAKLR